MPPRPDLGGPEVVRDVVENPDIALKAHSRAIKKPHRRVVPCDLRNFRRVETAARAANRRGKSAVLRIRRQLDYLAGCSILYRHDFRRVDVSGMRMIEDPVRIPFDQAESPDSLAAALPLGEYLSMLLDDVAQQCRQLVERFYLRSCVCRFGRVSQRCPTLSIMMSKVASCRCL